MKRSEFFERIMALPKEEVFGMTYKKKNGETRVATCKLRDAIADVSVKGTGMNREEKMNRLQVFQYFDVNSNAYRSAKLENIIDVTINGELDKIED
jgi:hypothetical protein